MSLSAFATPPLGKTERECEAQRRVTVWAGWEVVALCKGGEGRADRPEEVCTFVLSVSIGIPTENSLPDSCTSDHCHGDNGWGAGVLHSHHPCAAPRHQLTPHAPKPRRQPRDEQLERQVEGSL